MPRFPPVRIRTASAVGGCVFGLVTLVAAIALFTDPSLTPVGVTAAVAVSASTLSLPLWAAGLLYALSAGTLAIDRRRERILLAAAGASVALFLAGFAAVLSGTEPLRTIGDGAYVVATVLLLCLSIATLLVELRRRRAA